MKDDDMTQTFAQLGLSEDLVTALAKQGFNSPTPVQEAAIPLALTGKDILGSAQTGTGKTGAFGIPMVNHLLFNEDDTALIVTPTRELAAQVEQSIKSFLPHRSGINTALIIGGDSMQKQLKQLSFNPRIVVGTPGRLNDHLSRRTLKLNNTSFLVLDETDRMLDMGFSIQIEEIVSHMPPQRQTLLFSATLPRNIMSLAKNYLNEPERIAIGSTTKPAENIDHQTKRIEDGDKYEDLLNELSGRDGSVIIFVKTKHGADRLADKIKRDGFKAAAIHGDLRHNKRERVTDGFRKEKYKVLVATDVAARGLDIPHIQHVINYDLPQCPEDYIHRIGRTARAGAKGHALAYISRKEFGKWKAIERLVWGGETTDAPQARGGGNGGGKPRSFQDRKAKSHRKGGYGERNGGGEQRRSFGSDRDGNRGSYGDKKRSFGGDRDGNRSFGNRDDNRGNSYGDKKRSFGGDRDGNRSYGNRDDNRGNSYGDKKRSFGGDRDGNRSYGNRDDNRGNSYGDKKRSFGGDRDGNRGSYGDKKRSFGGDRDGNRGSYGDKKRSFGGDRDGNRGSYGDKKRSFGGDRDGNRSFGNRDDNRGNSYGDKKRSFGGDRDGNRGSYSEKRSFGERDNNGNRTSQAPARMHEKQQKRMDGVTMDRKKSPFKKGDSVSTYGNRGAGKGRPQSDRSGAGDKPFRGKAGFKGGKPSGNGSSTPAS